MDFEKRLTLRMMYLRLLSSAIIYLVFAKLAYIYTKSAIAPVSSFVLIFFVLWSVFRVNGERRHLVFLMINFIDLVALCAIAFIAIKIF